MGERLGQSRLVDGELHGLSETTPAPLRDGCRLPAEAVKDPAQNPEKAR